MDEKRYTMLITSQKKPGERILISDKVDNRANNIYSDVKMSFRNDKGVS